MTFSIDNPEGGLQQPPLRKICLGKPSGEQGLTAILLAILDFSKCSMGQFLHHLDLESTVSKIQNPSRTIVRTPFFAFSGCTPPLNRVR